MTHWSMEIDKDNCETADMGTASICHMQKHSIPTAATLHIHYYRIQPALFFSLFSILFFVYRFDGSRICFCLCQHNKQCGDAVVLGAVPCRPGDRSKAGQNSCNRRRCLCDNGHCCVLRPENIFLKNSMILRRSIFSPMPILS